MVRAVTEVGFENRRLPEATYAWLKAWYDSEQLQDEVAETIVGPCMNQHVSPSKVCCSIDCVYFLQKQKTNTLYCARYAGLHVMMGFILLVCLFAC